MSDDLFFTLAITAAIFVLALIVMSAFSKGGDSKEIEQRANKLKTRVSAIHTDVESARTLRKQVAQSRFPLLDPVLARLPSSELLQHRLERTGRDITVQNYLLLNAGILLGVVFILFIVLGKPLLIAFLLGIVAGIGLPHFIVGKMVNKRLNNFLRLFPDAIELIVRGLRSGLPMQEGLKVVAEEIADPVNSEFAHMTELINLGVTIEKSLTQTAERLKIPEFNFFVTSIILQRETGGNLAEILSNIAETIRARHMMKMKIKALSSEARASAMIVGVLPLMVMGAIQILTPDYLTIMYEDFRGNIMLSVAFGSLLSGFLVMRKMSNFDI